MAEENTTIILITECLQNGFFLDAESRLALPTDEALRMLIGSPEDFEPGLQDFTDEEAITALFKLTRKEERDLFRKFLAEKRRHENEPEAVTVEEEAPPSSDENGSQPPNRTRQSIEWLNRQMRNAGQLYAEFTEYRAEKLGSNKRNIASDLLKRGPLYQFLQAVTDIKGSKRKVPLHMINIRDWHQPSAQFDEERRRYGMHCEAGSWSAMPLDGFEKFLSPWNKTTEAEEAALAPEGFEENGIHYYDIRSDSVFDFYPTYQGKKVIPSQLEQVLNRIITRDEDQRVILVLIGVYTDIKVRILLTNLRSRYPVDNLIVSDVLTAAPSLERHLSGLDFAVKVLNVEVIHSLNELVQLVNPQHKEHAIPQSITQNSVNFRDYQTYFLDKQNLLAYQEQKQIQYLELTKRRAARVYHVIFVTSRNMMRLGLAFVFIAALAAGWAVLDPDRATSPYLTTTGFLGVAGIVQLMLVMYRNPIQELQKNLNNLVRLQTTLETQSLILALTRYHVSRPERLYPKDPQREREELANLQEQINIITKASEVTSKQLAQVGDTFETMTSNGNAGIPSSSEDMSAN